MRQDLWGEGGFKIISIDRSIACEIVLLKGFLKTHRAQTII
jgi:hypothetical protein